MVNEKSIKFIIENDCLSVDTNLESFYFSDFIVSIIRFSETPEGVIFTDKMRKKGNAFIVKNKSNRLDGRFFAIDSFGIGRLFYPTVYMESRTVHVSNNHIQVLYPIKIEKYEYQTTTGRQSTVKGLED